MEPKDSLPHSQVPATYPCAEPDQSSPCPPLYFLKIHLNLLPALTPQSGRDLNVACSSKRPKAALLYTS
jgi:hypothetical protein